MAEKWCGRKMTFVGSSALRQRHRRTDYMRAGLRTMTIVTRELCFSPLVRGNASAIAFFCQQSEESSCQGRVAWADVCRYNWSWELGRAKAREPPPQE